MDEDQLPQVVAESSMASSIGLITQKVCEQVMGQVMIVMNKQLADAIGKYFENERMEKEMLRKQYKDMKSMMDKMNDKLEKISEKVESNQGDSPLASADPGPTPAESWSTVVTSRRQTGQTLSSGVMKQGTPTIATPNKFATLKEIRDDMSDISEGTLEAIGKASKSDKEKEFRVAALKEARKMNKANRKSRGPEREAIKEFDVLFISSLARKSYRDMKVLFQGLGLELRRIKKLTWVAKSTLEVWLDKTYKAEVMGKLQSIGWNVRSSVALETTRTADAPEEVKHNQFQKAARHYGTLVYEARTFTQDKYYEEGLLAFIESKGERFKETVMIKINDIILAEREKLKALNNVDDRMDLEEHSMLDDERNDAAVLEVAGRPQ
jgi:hypothetical protein